MCFQNLLQSIVSLELKRVAQHWNKVRGSRMMPGWSDVRPSEISAQLPMIWIYKYDRAADLFTGRLAGDLIEHIFGKSFRGTPMTELYPKEDYPRLFGRCKRVVCEPALYRAEGMIFKHVDRFGRGERIMMPLAEDGIVGDAIFGATAYQTINGKPATNIPEDESWFPLSTAKSEPSDDLPAGA